MERARTWRVRPVRLLGVLVMISTGCAPSKPFFGFVEVSDWVVQEDWLGSDHAWFVQRLDSGGAETADRCERLRIGACEAIRCDRESRGSRSTWTPPAPTRFNAGEVDIAIDETSHRMRRGAGFRYSRTHDNPIAPGQRIRVSATGATVDPFTVSAIAPGIPRLDAPSSISPGDGLTLTWDPPPGVSTLRVAVSDDLFGAYEAVVCRIDAARGSVFIDPTLLERVLDEELALMDVRHETISTARSGVTGVELRVVQGWWEWGIPVR